MAAPHLGPRHLRAVLPVPRLRHAEIDADTGQQVAPSAPGVITADRGPLGQGGRRADPGPEASTGSAIRVQPAVAGGVVSAGSADGSVDAFPAAGCGAASCAALWAAEAGSGITGAPAVSGGQLCVGTGAGDLVAYRLG